MYATFQVMLISPEPPLLLMFPFMDHVTKVSETLDAERSDYNIASNMRNSRREVESIARRQVNGRYKGLLEVHDHSGVATVEFSTAQVEIIWNFQICRTSSNSCLEIPLVPPILLATLCYP
jgi:hypothetical protein